MTETIEIPRQDLKKILKMFTDATELLERIPELQDQGRFSEASQHIGAELEARITEMNKIEKNTPVTGDILDEIQNQNYSENTSLKELEKEVLD